MEVISLTAVPLLFFLGIYGLLTQKDLLKITVSFNIMESSMLLFLVSTGFQQGGSFPIVRENIELYVDPLPQALALTAIVIGASTTALMLALSIKIYKRYGTLDIDQIRGLKG